MNKHNQAFESLTEILSNVDKETLVKMLALVCVACHRIDSMHQDSIVKSHLSSALAAMTKDMPEEQKQALITLAGRITPLIATQAEEKEVWPLLSVPSGIMAPLVALYYVSSDENAFIDLDGMNEGSIPAKQRVEAAILKLVTPLQPGAQPPDSPGRGDFLKKVIDHAVELTSHHKEASEH